MSFFPASPIHEDPILKTGAMFARDTDPRKINVGIGAYRDDNGRPVVMRAVRHAEEYIFEHPAEFQKEYPPVGGNPEFLRLGTQLLFGADSKPLTEGKIATVHTVAGSGALYAGFTYLRTVMPKAQIYFPDVTWPNHKQIVDHVTGGAPIKTYRYYDEKRLCALADEAAEDILAMPKGSIILFHGCAHNPTGADFTPEGWIKVRDAVQRGGHLAFFDVAYPGFATGNVERDLAAPRMFAESGCEVIVAQSLSKIFGLYGERTGLLYVVHTGEPSLTASIISDICRLTRATWSMPPIHGADIARVILRTPELRKEWDDELTEMTGRIVGMRKRLLQELEKLGTPSPTADGTWKHIVEQKGMFTYLGISPAQCRHMISEHHIYLVESSRISVCGLNSHNVEYFAKALDETMRNCPCGK